MKKILSASNLKKNYHSDNNEIIALNDISFDLFENEFIAIVGPSGCGKSTLLSIIGNLTIPTDGKIILYGNYTIAYMLQDDCLLPFRTVYENCILGLEIQNKYNDDYIEYVNYLIDKYGLREFKDKYPESLSGGMRQRCALIRTLAIKPDILLLDEPTSALDSQTSLVVSEDIYKIIKNEGKTAILVTHDIGLAVSIADRVIVLGNRPASIKKIYTIKMNNKSTPILNRNTPEFLSYYNAIWEDLDVKI